MINKQAGEMTEEQVLAIWVNNERLVREALAQNPDVFLKIELAQIIYKIAKMKRAAKKRKK